MRLSVAACAAALWPALAAAQPEPPTAVAIADTRVEEVVVTRAPAEVHDATDVRVITRQDIELRQASFAADVLSTVPGVALSRNGAFGGITGVRMRGASADKTLVLIDGVVQNDASQPSGGYDFASLDLADIERIEILSGPQGSLWGSDAIGGVIAFTTREEDGWRAAVEGGSYGVAKGQAAAGVRRERWALSASVSGYRADGVSKADGFAEKDGFWSWTAGGSGRVDLSDAVSLDGRLRYNRSRAQNDGYDPVTFIFGDTGEFTPSKSWTGLARLTARDPLGFTHKLSFGGYRLERGFLGGAFPSTYWARRRDWRWTAERGGAGDPFAVAFGVERETTSASLSTGDRARLGNSSAFVTAHWRPWNRLTLSGAVRYDDPSGYAGRATAKAGAILDLGGGLSASADWGQGFKTPTISQTVCDFCSRPGPVVGLRPERATGWDAGLRWRSRDGRFEAGVTVYHLGVKDQIAYVDVGFFDFRYVNLTATRSNGAEADLIARLTGELTLRAAYGLTDAIDETNRARLVRVPKHAGSASLEWRRGRFSGVATVRAEGAQADTNPVTFAPAVRPGFALADVAAAWTLTDQIELTARIENLGDRHYQRALGYGEPRRALTIGFRVRD